MCDHNPLLQNFLTSNLTIMQFWTFSCEFSFKMLNVRCPRLIKYLLVFFFKNNTCYCNPFVVCPLEIRLPRLPIRIWYPFFIVTNEIMCVVCFFKAAAATASTTTSSNVYSPFSFYSYRMQYYFLLQLMMRIIPSLV